MSAPDWMKSASQKAAGAPDAKATRIQVTAEQRRLDQAAAVEVRRSELALERQRHAAKQQRRQEHAHARRQTRKAFTASIGKTAPIIGRRVMIVGPILMPMSVAWIGQIQFAKDTLGWTLAGALVFAAAWELTTAFAGWMYHQARQQGDRGTLFRAATWLFAASAGGMNYWHALGEGHSVYSPTPKAVSYGAMSLVGIALWELYASLIHRQQLRADGKLPAARPRFGLARWARFPRHTYRAWSITIRDGLATTEGAWAAVSDHSSDHPDGTKERPPVRVTIVRTTTLNNHLLTTFQRPVLTTPWGGLETTPAATRTTGHSSANDHRSTTTERPVTNTTNDHPDDRSPDTETTTQTTTPVTTSTTTDHKPRRPVTKKKTSRSDAEVNAAAVELFRQSRADGNPLSQRVLGARFDRSPGWARDRIKEAGLQRISHREQPAEQPVSDHPSDQSDDDETTAKEATG